MLAGTLSALQLDRYLASRATPAFGQSSPTGSILNASGPVAAAPFDFRAAAKRIIPSVVSVDSIVERETFMGERIQQNASSGSGVIISADGYIVTNSHVVRDPGDPTGRPASRFLIRLSDKRTVEAKIAGYDPRSDLALLKVTASGLVPAEFGDSKALEIGQWVLAVGNPLGYENTVSVGVVSSLNRETVGGGASTMFDAIQTDAAINQGNSGGALCDSEGKLIGINTAIASIGGGNIGIGFAIPVSRVSGVVQALLKHGYVPYAGLGVDFHSRPGLLGIPQARQEIQRVTGADSLPPAEGLLINNVFAQTTAAQAGIKQYDVLIAVDGAKVRTAGEYNRIIFAKKPGDKVKLRLWSAGETKEVTVALMDVGRNR